MAFDIIKGIETPQFTVLESYAVHRLGQYPSCLATFVECVYLCAPEVTVTATTDLNGDGLKEVLTVPTWSGSVTTSVMNQYLRKSDGTLLGQITSASLEVVTPAVTDSSGSIITPAVNTMKVTVSPAPATDLAGSTVAIIIQNPVGALAYRPAANGRRWIISLDSANPAQLNRMIQMLGTIYFKATKFALQALNLAVSDADIQTALQQVAQQGNNIDSIFGSEGDQLEIDRRAGNLSANVSPDAPSVN